MTTNPMELFGISLRNGLRCRADGCSYVSQVKDSSTMASLDMASQERRKHERAVHSLDIPQVKIDPKRPWIMPTSNRMRRS